MSNLRGRSIRTGFGAKALGFKNNSMKSIAAAGAVLALATTGTVVVQTQTAPAAVAQEAPAPTTEGTTRETAIEADAIANGYIKGQTSATNAANTLSGRAFEVDRGTPATFANGNTPVPDGTKVYMQWMDKDKSISPWYVTTVKTVQPSDGSQVGPGAYAFDLRKPWIDAHGKEHKYTASSGQYYRLVIPDYNTDDGNTMSMMRQAGGFFPGSFVNSVTGNNIGQFPLVGTNMQRTAVFMYEKPTDGYMTRPESEWIDDTEGPLRNASVSTSARNSISGKVWLETGAGDYANSATGPNDNVKDPQAENYTVVLSSLTSEGAQEYEAKVNSLPQSKRADAAKKLLTDHPEYISATVQAKTDADGRYTARFPEKTLNDQYIYGYVLNPEGQPIQAYSSYTSPQFRKPNENVSFTPQTAPAQNLTQRPMWYNVNFALVPTSQASLEITNFNATDKPAAPGDTLEISVNGTLSPLSNSIIWIDSKGQEVKRCDNVTTLQEANKCTFKVPEDAANEEVYTAQLVVADNIVAADSAMVKIPKQADEIEPGYEDGSGKPGSDVKIDAPTFTDKDGKDTQAPEGTKFTPGENAPEGVKVDESTGEITVPVPEDAKPGDKITVPVVVTYPDGSKDNVDVTVTVTEKDNGVFEPAYEGKLVVPGEETKSSPTFTDKDGKDVEVPADSKFTIGEDFTAPEGYDVKIDENTGEITVTFPDGSKLNKDTVEEFDVPVTVTYPDETTDEVKANFKLDTDGDGKPDTEDEDDDNDGIPDKEEKDKGSNPKDKGSIPATPIEPGNPTNAATFEPKYEGKLVVPGEETKSTPNFTDKDGKDVKAPEGSKFKITDGFNVPEGYEVSIDENTGEITVTFPDGSKLDKDTVEEFDVPVTVTYPDETTDEVKANFKLDTDGDGKPDTEDEDDDNDGIPDKEEKDKGSNPKDKGSIPATPLEPGNPTNAATFEPGYEDGSGKPGSDVKIDAPKFTDKDNNPAEKPDGTKFTPGENAPDGVKVDESTGEITVPVPEDAEPGSKITVPVVVTYPDGSKDNVDVTVTVEQPDVPEDPEVPAKVDYRPAYGGPVVVPAGGSKTAEITYDGPKAPEGTKYVLDPNYTVPNGWDIKVDPKTGTVTATVDEAGPNGARQEELVVPVQVQYPESANATGNDVANATFLLDTDKDGTPDTTDKDDDGDGVTDQDEKDKGSDPKDPNSKPEAPVNDFQPNYEEKTVPAGQSVTSDVTFTGEPKPEGTKFSIADNFVAPHGWSFEVNPETGAVTATVVPAGPDGARQEQVIVPIVVTYPDGTATSNDTANAVFNLDTDGDGTPDSKDDDDDNDGVTDEVEKEKGSDPKDPDSKPQPDAPAEDPKWEDTTTTPDKPVDIPNTGGDVPADTTVETNGPGTAEIKPDGTIVVTPNEDAKPGDKIEVIVKDKDGNEIDRVVVEVEQPEAPAEKPDWKDDSGKPGDKVEIPNNGGDVPAGTTVETDGPGKAEIDENGKLIVDIDKDAKPGDKVVVVVKDKDGNEIDRVVVEVEKPEAPAKDPKWEDTTTTPDKPVEIPNTGGDVPAGTTVETEGPGKAEIDENGKITVTPDKDAKPGDKIKVVVKDKDGKVIDEVTVTVTDKDDQGGPSGSLNDPNKIGAIIGGTIVGSGLIGALLGNHDGAAGSAGSSTPGKPGEAKPGKPGAEKPGKGEAKPGEKPGKGNTGNQGGADNGAAGNQSAGKGSTGATSQSAEAGSRGGSLAVTGVSGLAITLGASVIALALGGALMALRRRQS